MRIDQFKKTKRKEYWYADCVPDQVSFGCHPVKIYLSLKYIYLSHLLKHSACTAGWQTAIGHTMSLPALKKILCDHAPGTTATIVLYHFQWAINYSAATINHCHL
jgi:hypothetical protein